MAEQHEDASAPPREPADRIGEDDGVDVTLVRWALSLTPRERLALLQAQADSLAKLRDAASKR